MALASHIAETADRTTHAVGILLDVARSRLGEGIPIHRSEGSIGVLVRDVADRIAAAHPERRFSVEGGADERGEWDAARISQALANLIENAVEHGTAGTPVTVHVNGDENDVYVSVHNRGTAIPREQLATLFDLRGAAPAEGAPPRESREELGLDLYIAERIVRAHGGSIIAKSSEVHGNTFTVCLPRHAPPERRKAVR